MEASALQAPATLSEAPALQAPAARPEPKIGMPSPLLRLRSDEQLVALFRAGHDDAFRAIHDRYHKRLFAYARQMLPARQDAEDALQDVFVRAYSGLRASDRQLALRAWLFRVAHNRCVDELRRPAPPPPEVLQLVRSNVPDPLAEVDLRESLRRLIDDIRRLPDQQRSALLMRELAGMAYADISASMGISAAAVKSLLVRARVSLAQAAEARDTACVVIRCELVDAHDRGVRPNANARKHMRDCVGCKSFRRELRGVTRQLAATTPAIGPLGILAKLLGFSGGAGGGAAGGATAGGGAVLITGGATASAGGLGLGASHLATLLVAAVATAGGAVEIQHTIISPVRHVAHHRAGHAHTAASAPSAAQPVPAVVPGGGEIQAIAAVAQATASIAPDVAPSPAGPSAHAHKHQARKPVGAGGAGMAPSARPRMDGSSTGSEPTVPASLTGAPTSTTTTSPASGSGTCGTSTPTTGTTSTGSTSTTSGSSPTTSSTAPPSSGTTSGTAPSCSAPTTSTSSGTTSSSSTTGSTSDSSGTTSSTSTSSGTSAGSGTGTTSLSGTGSSSGGSSASAT